jgi:uncharacterized protein YoxC
MSEQEVIKNLKRTVKALELKIEGSDINQKFLLADRNRSHWHAEYRKIEAKYNKLKEKCNKKQKYIDNVKQRAKKLF